MRVNPPLNGFEFSIVFRKMAVHVANKDIGFKNRSSLLRQRERERDREREIDRVESPSGFDVFWNIIK